MTVQWKRHGPPPDTPNAEHDRERIIQTLDELILLHGVSNARANSGSWPVKRAVLALSSLAINAG